MTSETIVPKMIVQYEWILENVGREQMTIASKMILFRGEKVFRVGLKTQSPILFVVAIDLNKMGMKVEDVKFRIQGSGLGPATNPTMMEMTRDDIGNEGNLQLFTATLNGRVLGNCTFSFRISIEGTDPGYSFQLRDRLAKDQLWAALKNQQNLADVEFVVKDKTFPAHKSILAARSPVFAAEFEKVQPVNGVRLQIRIDDVESATVEKFLHFIYTGEPKGYTFADEELLKLADHCQLKTLASLCKLAAKKMDSTQMAKVRQRLNIYGELSDSKSKIMPEKETEIFFDRTTPTFRCTSTFQISRDGNEQPKCVMQYQNENICVAYNIGATTDPNGNAYIRNPEIHLTCAKHLRFGLKVEDVYCRDAYFNSWLKMESKYFQRNSELLLDFSAKSLGTIIDLQSVPFDVKCISTIGNYCYEMMDEGWTKDFWVAATNKKFTDVKIYVGSVEVMEVHRVILCARSHLLNLSLDKIRNKAGNTAGKHIVTFEAEFDVEVVKNFLNFLYTGSLKTTDNVQQLSKLATMYEVETLKKYVCQQLLNANPPVEEVTDYLFLL